MLYKLKTIENQNFEVALIRNYCRHGINSMVMFNHLATDCSLLPATFQDLRFGIKFIFSFKTQIIDGDEVLNSSDGTSTHIRLPCFTFFLIYSYECEHYGCNVWLENITFCQ
jgi:hypothetical protein